jgi:hypothetical protein
MFKSLIRATLVGFSLPLSMLGTVGAYAETMAFSYTFAGNFEPLQTWAPGATLTGQIDGSVDPMDPDRVIINSFGQVVLSRPGLPPFEYDAIDTTEFNADPDGQTPVMSFSGVILNFRSCPEGFTDPGDCPFGLAPGGGFAMFSDWLGGAGLATAADGSGDLIAMCAGERRLQGCRVIDAPILAQNWGLVVLPDSAVVDPSAVIGSGSTIKKDAVIEAGATLGKNVIVNKDGVIGAGAGIGNDSEIKKGAYVCPGITIGAAVTIGKNRLVDTDVPDGIVWNPTNNPPDPEDCL